MSGPIAIGPVAMPFLYVYSPEDFVGGLPAESGAAAAGSGTFELTLVEGAKPTLIEISDNDLIFDEVDGSQTLTESVDIDGESYAAGTTISTAYDLINSDTEHKVTSFHLGGNGYQQGAVDGLISTVPLEGGETYSFDVERTSHKQDNAFEDYVACFATGTLIETASGPRPVETLVAGDLIQTLDHGPQPLRGILGTQIPSTALHNKANLRPVVIAKGALGRNLPSRDLRVSPQHRIVANSPIVERMFGISEVLVSAKKLVGLPGISVDNSLNALSYFHLVMGRHEIIFAENTPTESFFPGPLGLASLPPEQRVEIEALFPNLPANQARLIPEGREQLQLAQRHLRNGKNVVSEHTLRSDKTALASL